jgi:hypothetical protein
MQITSGYGDFHLHHPVVVASQIQNQVAMAANAFRHHGTSLSAW